MPDKCKWKNRKFEGCEAMESALRICRHRNDEPLFKDGVKYCAYCGADIRKPEESPK